MRGGCDDPQKELETTDDETIEMAKVFLIRHVSPDWNHTGIPYDIPPGPPLSSKGKKEAEALAEFLSSQGVVKLYYSPFERSATTAEIVSTMNGIPCDMDERLTEWREVDERGEQVRERMLSIFENVSKESIELGPIGLVSHGGPTTFLLQGLGIEQEELAKFRKKFDTTNPLPPAGVWKAEQDENNKSWNLKLAFVPSVNQA